jgi:hypothetical protein
VGHALALRAEEEAVAVAELQLAEDVFPGWGRQGVPLLCSNNRKTVVYVFLKFFPLRHKPKLPN